MELTRRQFAFRLTAAAGAALGGMWGVLKAARPTAVVRAVRARLYPGRVRELNDDRVGRPGPWAG